MRAGVGTGCHAPRSGHTHTFVPPTAGSLAYLPYTWEARLKACLQAAL